MILSSPDWTTHVVGRISEWINCDSPDAYARANSVAALRQEVAWACHLTLPALLFPTPRTTHTNYFRELSHVVMKSTHMSIWVRVPMCREDGTDPWEDWQKLRSLCEHHPNLHLALELTEDTPDLPVLQRWLGESVKAVIVPSSIWLTNKQGFPVLSKRYQKVCKMYLNRKAQFVISGGTLPLERLAPYQQYLAWLCKPSEQTQQERFESPYADWLQVPLQPLQDNLESATYETFEKDPVKYQQYENAIAQALEERFGVEDTPCVMVVGAGRGPLVAAALRAGVRAGRKMECWAVEKNPNAVVTLQNRKLREGWGDKVRIISSDMRDWVAEHKADILVSELLGSFSDNELSPECLDGAQRFLKHDGISIPAEYTSYVAPLASSKLWNDAKAFKEKEKMETMYVVKVHAGCQLAEAVKCFHFAHPHWEQHTNERQTEMEWSIQQASTIHGFVGYFDSRLYGEHYISINPANFSTGMFSWFPMYIPIREPMYVPGDSKIKLQMWRCCNEAKVWYEWAVTEPSVSAIHNVNGRSQVIGL